MISYELVNLTDRPVNFFGYSWPAPPSPARAEQREVLFGDFTVRHPAAPGGALVLPISTQLFRKLHGLPAPEQGKVFLVSRTTSQGARDWALKHGLKPRQDLWVPGPFNKETGQYGSVSYG
jgi:hypothetical protein